MDWSQMPRGLVVLLTIATVVGLAAAPVAAVDDGSTLEDDGSTLEDDDVTQETQDDGETEDDGDDTDTVDDGETEDDGDDAETIDDGETDDGDGTLATDDGVTDDDSTAETDAGVATTTDEDEVPAIACTDVTEAVADGVAWDRVIWVDDLPEDLQPESVPWTIVTPRAVAGIVVGVTPNQCDVYDPNDPPYDPREDDLDPDGDASVAETDEGSTLIVVNGTLNRSADGPGGEGSLEADVDGDGAVDPRVTVDDGEKDYGVDPGVQYWEDGTVYLENDVVVMGKRVGGEVDCNGETCDVDLRGLVKLVNPPSVPSHTNADHTADGGGDVSPGLSTTAGDGPLGLGGDPAARGGGSGAGAGGDGSADGASGSGGSGGDGGAPAGDGGTAGDGAAGTSPDGSDGSDDRSPLAGLLGGPGLGLGLAGLGFLFTTMVARVRPF